MTDLTNKELAKHLGISKAKLERELLSIGMGVLQSEADRLRSIEVWEQDRVAEDFKLKASGIGLYPEIRHFKQAWVNLEE